MLNLPIKWDQSVDLWAANVLRARQGLKRVKQALERARTDHYQSYGEGDYVEEMHPDPAARKEVRETYKEQRKRLHCSINELKRDHVLAKKWVLVAEAQLAACVAKHGVDLVDPNDAVVTHTITITGGVVTEVTKST